MFVNHEHKFVFVAIQKTATRSIYSYLKENLGGKQLNQHRPDIPAEYKRYFSFCVSRNPYDRICSEYWSKCRRDNDRYQYKKRFEISNLENSLENFLSMIPKRHGRAVWQQALFIKPNRIDKILRFENLQDDFNTLPFISSGTVLPHANSTSTTKIIGDKIIKPRPPWEELVTPVAGRMINKLFEEDFKLLNYEMMEF